MKFNSSARFNRKSFNSEKVFDAGIHLGGTITNHTFEASLTEIEEVVNGTFETGDLTNWTVTKSSTGSAVASNDPTYVYSGSYGCLITTAGATTFPNDDQYVMVSQAIDLSSVNELTFQYKHIFTPTSWVSRSCIVQIEGSNVFTDNTPKTDWTYKSIDVSSYSGIKTVSFWINVSNRSGSGSYTNVVALDIISAKQSTLEAGAYNQFEFGIDHEKTIEESHALTHTITPADITATIKLTPEVMAQVFIDTTTVIKIPFENGSSEITVGETVTGATSGATGTVTIVEVTGGTWGSGDAEGYIYVEDPSGVFEDEEEINGADAGEDAANISGDPTSITPKVIEKSCWKSIDEVYWTGSVLLDGLYAFTDVAGFKELQIRMKDHTATEQLVFGGFIPNQGITQNPGDNTTRLTAYSYSWFLANQMVPDENRGTATWVPSGSSGYVTFLEPSVVVTALLGGALWNRVTGCNPLWVVPVANWGSASIPVRGWAWEPGTNKWQAIQEMCDYLGYVFEVTYDDIYSQHIARFCALAYIDTYLGVPAAVTFTKTDAAKYVLNVSKERRGTEFINRIRVHGKRNKRVLNFVNGITQFTPGHTVLDGGTGATATIISCTKTEGAWGGTAVGYLIISYDRTGDFLAGDTIIDALGAAWGEATMQGNSILYETFDEYSYYVESSDVTNGDERPRERFFELEEEFDSTPLIEAKCLEYYNMFALDPTPYNVEIRDRSDLRLWQKVKLVGWSEIPEEWMRIVSIRYTETSGGDVRVSATLNNANYVITQRKMRRSLKNSDVTAIEKIIKDLLKSKEVKVGEVLAVQGEGVIIKLEDGEIVVTARNP